METTAVEESYETRRAREVKEMRVRNERTREIIKGACEILGFTLEKGTCDDESYVSITARKGGESIHFTAGTYYLANRISVAGNFPNTEKGDRVDPYRYSEKRHEITVSVLKPAERIAKDIERRFLPRYRELLKRAVEIVNQSNDYARKCAKNLEVIKGKTPTEAELKESTLRVEGLVCGEIRVRAEDVAIELRAVPVETARKIMNLIVLA